MTAQSKMQILQMIKKDWKATFKWK